MLNAIGGSAINPIALLLLLSPLSRTGGVSYSYFRLHSFFSLARPPLAFPLFTSYFTYLLVYFVINFYSRPNYLDRYSLSFSRPCPFAPLINILCIRS